MRHCVSHTVGHCVSENDLFDDMAFVRRAGAVMCSINQRRWVVWSSVLASSPPSPPSPSCSTTRVINGRAVVRRLEVVTHEGRALRPTPLHCRGVGLT